MTGYGFRKTKVLISCELYKSIMVQWLQPTSLFFIFRIVVILLLYFTGAKFLQKSEMRKDIVIELSYKGFG